jgi:hypothetical protein
MAFSSLYSSQFPIYTSHNYKYSCDNSTFFIRLSITAQVGDVTSIK